jgi:hypothetical protein
MEWIKRTENRDIVLAGISLRGTSFAGFKQSSRSFLSICSFLF